MMCGNVVPVPELIPAFPLPPAVHGMVSMSSSCPPAHGMGFMLIPQPRPSIQVFAVLPIRNALLLK